jgi:hypothetical protein
MRRLFANSAFSAVLRAVLAIFAILAGVTRVSTRAGRGENVERDLVEEKYRQHDLSYDREERSLAEHG